MKNAKRHYNNPSIKKVIRGPTGEVNTVRSYASIPHRTKENKEGVTVQKEKKEK